MALTQAAYFRMVNEQGGIAGRQINFIFYDDGYSPPKAVEMVRRLVESDQVGFLFGTLGTPSNSAIAPYCNRNKMPQLLGAAEIGWKPLHFVATTSTSVNGTLKPAGLDHATGVISAAYMKDATDPRWADDPAMVQWRAFMARYMPNVDQANEHTARAYAMAFVMRFVLEQCGQDFSRENVLKQALAQDGLTVPIFLPGITVSTSPTNHEPIRAMQLTRFNGQSWEPFGEVIQSIRHLTRGIGHLTRASWLGAIMTRTRA